MEMSILIFSSLSEEKVQVWVILAFSAKMQES